MEWNLKRCCTSSKLLRPCCMDKFTSLPDELLSRILSLLPTKDAAATQVLSKKMRRAFSWITSVDLDDSSLCNCHKRLPVDRFPLFESFIDNVLGKLSPDQPLTRFRLRVGGDTFPGTCLQHNCVRGRFPYVKPVRLNAWISHPLANCGLRELDLAFLVQNSSECKLPPHLFDCQSLEVLKLDSNLKVGNVVEIPLIRLPNLKVLHLRSFIFSEDDFVTRLVSNCASLEDLLIECVWEKMDRLAISSHSLRRLDLDINASREERTSDLVLIDTPNLEYLKYTDNLSRQYTVPHFNLLVEAHIDIKAPLDFANFETSFAVQLTLLSTFSDVQHLSLLGFSAEGFCFAGELKDQLPVFRNLTTLELGSLNSGRWDILLLLILHSSPLLETLVFPEGLDLCVNDNPCEIDKETFALEAESWRITRTIPSCLTTHLKRIEFKRCFGYDRELNMIKFLLSKALVLKDFVITLLKDSSPYNPVRIGAPDLDQLERTLVELPRASNFCSFIVYQESLTYVCRI